MIASLFALPIAGAFIAAAFVPCATAAVHQRRAATVPAVPQPLTIKLDWSGRAGDIIVSLADRRLYFLATPQEAIAYPIAIPAKAYTWTERFEVSDKREWPSWASTDEMRRLLPNLPKQIEGGAPGNPLGARALYLGSTLYRIHGTDAPQTIGRAITFGCIRMHDAHVIDLYERVAIGAIATVVKTPLHKSRAPAGLEVQPSAIAAARSQQDRDGVSRRRLARLTERVASTDLRAQPAGRGAQAGRVPAQALLMRRRALGISQRPRNADRRGRPKNALQLADRLWPTN